MTGGPLQGIRVIDMTAYVAGPLCTQLLADMGASVIKVERPPGGDVYRRQGPEFIDGESLTFLALNRGKRSIAVDAKLPEGRAILEQLIGDADVFVHNLKPGTAERLGLGQQAVRALSARVVWAALSGYGGVGPKGSEGGYDLMMQGESGLMAATGYPDGDPVKAGFAVVDIAAGIGLALGITSALLERERTGAARACESSLYETSISMGTILAERYLANGSIPTRSGSASSLFAPYQSFRTSDGYVTVEGTGPPGAWTRFCNAIQAPNLLDDPAFQDNASRVHNRVRLEREVETRTANRPTAYWVARFREAGLPCGTIQHIGEALESEQTHALGMVAEVAHSKIGTYQTVRNPLRFDPPAALSSGAPLLGEHTAEVLHGIGYDEDSVLKLGDMGVVVTSPRGAG